MPTKEELRQLQALPLDLKIVRTQQRIREWVRHYGVNGVYISFSGGKNSTVLLHIAREMYPEIEAVFVNTGLEYPEIQKFVRDFPNVRVVYPRKTFKQVMTEYGYPLISKTVSHSVGVLRRNPDGRVAHNLFAPEKSGPFAMFKWKPLADVDFCLSEKCCDFTKKEPAHRYSRQSGKGLKPYHTAAECIDWSIPAQSIFERDKPLAENTLRRIARGIEKFVINNPEPFIVTVNHSGEGFRGQKADEPLGTVTAKNGYGVVTPTIMCNNTGNAGAAVDTPLPTVTTGNRNYMVAPSIVPIGYGERKGQEPRVNRVDEPLGTVVTSGKHYLVAPSLIQYHSETANDEVRGQELSEPLMTVDTSPRYALSVAHIMKNYGGNYQGAGSGADKPLDTVTAHDHNSLVTAHILTMRNNMDGQPADEPLATITAGGSHHAEVQAFLVKYFSNGTPKPVNSPLDTVTTKDRFALVTIHGEEYIITDIKMRMLQPRELFNAQGFPTNYIIDHDDSGRPYPKSKQTARCGNAVTPPVPAALVRANLPEMCSNIIAERN